MPSRRGINSQETASTYAEDIPEQPNSTCEEDSVRRKSSIAIAATLLAFRQREKMPRPSTPALHHPGNGQRSSRMSISIIAIPCEIYKYNAEYYSIIQLSYLHSPLLAKLTHAHLFLLDHLLHILHLSFQGIKPITLTRITIPSNIRSFSFPCLFRAGLSITFFLIHNLQLEFDNLLQTNTSIGNVHIVRFKGSDN